MRYRDTKTGRFTSKAKWERSKARGDTRYKRERPVKVPRKAKVKITPPPPRAFELGEDEY